VTLENDANAAAYGEYWAGAGKDGGDLVMLTLGTGLGGGAIIDGRILHGHFDNAAEIGHMIVVAGGLECPCGQRGCVEQYASASAVARRVNAALDLGELSTLSPPFTSEKVVEHAQEGDSLCLRIWDDACFYLSLACVNIQHLYNPARIVIGGGMADAGSFLLDRLHERVREQTWDLCDDSPEIMPATLGYDAGVIGAAGLAFRASQG
jgi:glucokinase